MGLQVTLATNRCHVLDNPWGDNAIPLRFDDPQMSGLSILGAYDAIVAVGDRPALIAAVAAERLGLRFHRRAAVEACNNKFLARELFRAAGLAVPEFFRACLEDDPRVLAAQAPFPCVLKPLSLSASRGVIRADSVDEFVAAFERIRKLLETPDIRRLKNDADRQIQVERYIPGAEFALEGLVTEGSLRTLALFDKPDPLTGPYFEETIYITPSRQDSHVQRDIIAATESAVEALGLTQGPVHAEMRHNEQGTWMLEVAARPIGGLCAQALRFNGGLPLEQILLAHALGEEPGELSLDGPAAGVMMIPIPERGVYQSVEGVEDALRVPGIEGLEITAKQAQVLVPLPEGASYLGFLFARGAEPAEVETALRTAHSSLRFTITPALPTLAPGP